MMFVCSGETKTIHVVNKVPLQTCRCKLIGIGFEINPGLVFVILIITFSTIFFSQFFVATPFFPHSELTVL